MALIGISGKIGSGKDTVGSMIQYLTAVPRGPKPFHPLVDYSIDSPWQVRKFAGPLKKIASTLTGIPVAKFEDQEFKKTLLGPEWGNMTVREFLQKLGTEAIRNGLHTDSWINAAVGSYAKVHAEPGEMVSLPDWVFTDMRFLNEMESIKKRGGITIRIWRETPKENYKTLEALHPSETALDQEEFDYNIANIGTLDNLLQQVKAVMTDAKLL